MTRHFYTVSSSGMSCKFCGKAFNRSFNLRRHENEYCPLKSEEREMSETKSLTAGSEDDASSVTTDGFQSSMTVDSETEEEEADPWMPMVEEAMQKHKAAFQEIKMNLTQSGLDEETAGETVDRSHGRSHVNYNDVIILHTNYFRCQTDPQELLAVNSTRLKVPPVPETMKYYLIYEQECFIRRKTLDAVERFKTDKARIASVLNSFKNYPFHTYLISLFSKEFSV